MLKDQRITKGRALIDALERHNGGEDENKRQEESEDEDYMEESPVGNHASGDLELHQTENSIATGNRHSSDPWRILNLHFTDNRSAWDLEKTSDPGQVSSLIWPAHQFSAFRLT